MMMGRNLVLAVLALATVGLGSLSCRGGDPEFGYPMRPLAPHQTDYNGAGMVAAKSEINSRYRAWMAFSDINGHGHTWISGVYDSPTWISYDHKRSVKVRAYRFYFTNGGLTSRAPKHFQLQTERSGVWETIDERKHETNWQGAEERTYCLKEEAVGQKFRIMFFDDNDVRSGVVVISLTRIQFLGVVA